MRKCGTRKTILVTPSTAHVQTVGVITALFKFYDAWHAAEPQALTTDGTPVPQKAATWRAKLAEWQATTQPAEPDS